MARKRILNPLTSVAPGENPNGFVAQTANETARRGNSEVDDQWRYGMQADGKRWNGGSDPYNWPPIAGRPNIVTRPEIPAPKQRRT